MQARDAESYKSQPDASPISYVATKASPMPARCSPKPARPCKPARSGWHRAGIVLASGCHRAAIGLPSRAGCHRGLLHRGDRDMLPVDKPRLRVNEPNLREALRRCSHIRAMSGQLAPRSKGRVVKTYDRWCLSFPNAADVDGDIVFRTLCKTSTNWGTVKRMGVMHSVQLVHNGASLQCLFCTHKRRQTSSVRRSLANLLRGPHVKRGARLPLLPENFILNPIADE